MTEPEQDMAEFGCLSLDVKLEYGAYPRERVKEVFGLITIANREREAGPKSPKLDLLCIIDVSGSMEGERLSIVKQSIMFVLDEMKDGDSMGVVVFNSSPRVVVPLTSVGAGTRGDICSAVHRLYADGGTDILGGLRCGADVLRSRTSPSPTSAAFLLTDGYDGAEADHEDFIEEVAKAYRSSSTPLYTFGIGQAHNAGLLSTYGERCRTPYTYIEEAVNIPNAIAGALGCAKNVLAKQVTVSCSGVQHAATISNVWCPYDMERDGSRITVEIPDISAGERKDLVFEVKIPNGEDLDYASPVLGVQLRYVDITRGTRVLQDPVPVVLEKPMDSQEPEDEPDTTVSHHLNRIRVAEALESAARCCSGGRADDGQKRLSEVREQLDNKRVKVSDTLLADLKNAEALIHDAERDGASACAELLGDAQMHKYQRCTTNARSSSSQEEYLTPVQSDFIRRATTSPP